MNQLTCPTCNTTQKVVGQFQAGAITAGALVVLDCAHAWELIPPRIMLSGDQKIGEKNL